LTKLLERSTTGLGQVIGSPGDHQIGSGHGLKV